MLAVVKFDSINVVYDEMAGGVHYLTVHEHVIGAVLRSHLAGGVGSVTVSLGKPMVFFEAFVVVGVNDSELTIPEVYGSPFVVVGLFGGFDKDFISLRLRALSITAPTPRTDATRGSSAAGLKVPVVVHSDTCSKIKALSSS